MMYVKLRWSCVPTALKLLHIKHNLQPNAQELFPFWPRSLTVIHQSVHHMAGCQVLVDCRQLRVWRELVSELRSEREVLSSNLCGGLPIPRM